MFDSGFTGSEFDSATFGRFQKRATGNIAQRTLARGVRHVVVEGGRINRLVVVVMSLVMAAATRRGGMFGHRLTVLRAERLQPK